MDGFGEAADGFGAADAFEAAEDFEVAETGAFGVFFFAAAAFDVLEEVCFDQNSLN